MRPLKEKVVVITGASGGIGSAIARHFADEQAKLVLCGRNKDRLQETIGSLNLSRGNVQSVIADITKATGMKKIVRSALKKFNRIDIFINSAAIGINKLFIRTTEKEFDAMMATNVKSIFYSFHELLPVMQKQGSGQIINISAMAGKQGVPGLSLYSASKAAMNILSESVASEVRNENIKVCVLAPASVDTNFMSNYAPRSKTPSKAVRKISADEVAAAAIFMAKTDQNSWMSLAEIRPLLIKN